MDITRRPSQAQSALNNVFWIDSNDVCNLKCPTCIRGLRGMVNSGHKLALSKFEAIIKKAKDEGYKQIGVFNWTEPFTNPELAEYMSLIKQHGVAALLSSNFSLRRIPHLEAVLRHTDLIYVSVSGFDQNIYEINHVGGSIEFVKGNLRRAGELKAKGLTGARVLLRFLKFPYNHEEENKLKDFAEEIGVEFEVIPGLRDPKAPGAIANNETYLRRMDSYNSEQPFQPRGKVCSLMFGQIPVDSHGDVYLCCAYPNYPALKIGKYLELTQEEILLRRYKHPVCASCDRPRRDATETDKQALLEAIQYEMNTA